MELARVLGTTNTSVNLIDSLAAELADFDTAWDARTRPLSNCANSACPLNGGAHPDRRNHATLVVRDELVALVRAADGGAAVAGELAYCSLGSGLLAQDARVVVALLDAVQAESLPLRVLHIALVDPVFAFDATEPCPDDRKIADAVFRFCATLTGAVRERDALSAGQLRVSVRLFDSAHKLIAASAAGSVPARWDFVGATDVTPDRELQADLHALVTAVLTPRSGVWFCSLKFSDSPDEPNLPAHVVAMMRARGATTHACLVLGRQDPDFVTRVFDLKSLPDKAAWLEYPRGVQLSMHDPFGARVALLAMERFMYSYTQAMGAGRLPSPPLCLAALSKRRLWVRFILEAFPADERAARANDLSTQPLRATPLHYAIANYSEPGVMDRETMTVLLDFGADVNARAEGRGQINVPVTVRDTTPLHWAALYGAVAVIELLLSRGADARLVDSDGATALHIACERGKADCASALLAASPLAAKRRDGRTARDLAVAAKLPAALLAALAGQTS